MVGFKSFCDRTPMHFTGGGIAAIVGPNGCGKSNVSDAINWVLGEQSAKSMRGERMADVIFNGTSNRKPTGMAEVTLTMLDPDYVDEPAPIEVSETEAGTETVPVAIHAHRKKSHEVVVSRRLFRSGESEYLLNGQTCRLRDIQELFMGTGLGPESYALIEQGRIGQILSSRPHDRRAIIEEAAGITGFKTKKRLSEARLEESKLNLARINDIFEEVTRQMNSLKRQAAKAERYGKLRDEMRIKLRVVLASKFALIEQESRELQAQMN